MNQCIVAHTLAHAQTVYYSSARSTPRESDWRTERVGRPESRPTPRAALAAPAVAGGQPLAC